MLLGRRGLIVGAQRQVVVSGGVWGAEGYDLLDSEAMKRTYSEFWTLSQKPQVGLTKALC